MNHYREYVRLYFSRLRLKRCETDVCNTCCRIDIELQDTINLINAARQCDLELQEEMHLADAKTQQRKAMNNAVKLYRNARYPDRGY